MVNLDPKDVLGSTDYFPNQCEQIWEDAKKIDFPPEYRGIKNIVFCGMGGSSYGGRISAALFKDKLKVPLVTNDDYSLPGYADETTLVILSSYSGTTEEVLSCGQEALEKGTQIIGLTNGDELGEFLHKNNLPALVFDPRFNPSRQPRLGTGYMVLGSLAIMNKIGLVAIPDQEVREAIDLLKQLQNEIKKSAKDLAQKIYGRIPLIFAAEFLKGNIYILRNQFNETAKSFASFTELPDLNHHLMEGLKNPPDKKLITLFIESDFYSDKLKKRVELTKDVVEKNGISVVSYTPLGNSKLSQVLNVLSFGGYLTFYLAMLYNQDPSVIPWVDYFKEQLEKE